MACGLHGFCVNPCNHVCAVHTGAKCEAKRHRATCWCPNVGQPWKRCFSAQEVNGTSTVGHAGSFREHYLLVFCTPKFVFPFLRPIQFGE